MSRIFRESRRTTKRQQKEQQRELAVLAVHEKIAQIEGPVKKKWTLHDLKSIKPLTENQEAAFHAFNSSDHLSLVGTAGTGKTLLALFFALRDIVDPNYPQKSVRIIRSAVSSRDIGFLPGDEDEKMAVYEAPYRGMCQFLFGRPSTYDDMKAAGLIKFESSSFARGDTWTNEFIIIDEIQNLTFHEINTLATRVGEGTRLILVGDGHQNDLQNHRGEKSGFDTTMNVLKHIKSISNVAFGIDDIVRSGFVKEWIIAVEKTERDKKTT